jgi:phosphoglycerate dehydrogenase-like enzyme
MAGKTLGILGFGHIGEALMSRAHAFDMKVCAIRRHPSPDTPSGLMFIGGPERLDDLLSLSDYLVITLPLSAETRGLIDVRRLGLMKSSAYLINVARAEIVDEQALYHALAGKHLAGAALDVWYRYPTGAGNTAPANAPFHELDNVIMTPHVSGWTEGMIDARAAVIAENIARTARGETPLNPIALAD